MCKHIPLPLKGDSLTLTGLQWRYSLEGDCMGDSLTIT
jgi:hypothetical protein